MNCLRSGSWIAQHPYSTTTRFSLRYVCPFLPVALNDIQRRKDQKAAWNSIPVHVRQHEWWNDFDYDAKTFPRLLGILGGRERRQFLKPDLFEKNATHRGDSPLFIDHNRRRAWELPEQNPPVLSRKPLCCLKFCLDISSIGEPSSRGYFQQERSK